MSRLLAPSNAVPLKVAQREASPEKFLPYARHVNEEMVALDSGDIMLTFELQGRAFETADVRDLNDWHTKLNGMLRKPKHQPSRMISPANSCASATSSTGPPTTQCRSSGSNPTG